VAEAFTSPEIVDRGMLSTLPHPTAGSVPNIAPPFKLAGTPLVDPLAAPALGAHTAEILREVLDLEAERYARLAAAGVFGASPPAF
jgi:crotonobetainyl-CoA:carnitine CoA-transferase CaiB-like acyl-CoA transferase